jgi:hypothetical protein
MIGSDFFTQEAIGKWVVRVAVKARDYIIFHCGDNAAGVRTIQRANSFLL